MVNSQPDSPLYYFGYGANRSDDRLEKIFGERPIGGSGAIIHGFALCYQKIMQIPDPAKTLLQQVWGDSFRGYTIKSHEGVVAGRIWELSQEQLELLKTWEFVGSWKELISVSVVQYDGTTVQAVTEKAPDEADVFRVADGLWYDDNLNGTKQSFVSNDDYRIGDARKILEQLSKSKKTADIDT